MIDNKTQPKHRLVRGEDLPYEGDNVYRCEQEAVYDWLFNAEEHSYVATRAGTADSYAKGDITDADLDAHLARVLDEPPGVMNLVYCMMPRLPVEFVEQALQWTRTTARG